MIVHLTPQSQNPQPSTLITAASPSPWLDVLRLQVAFLYSQDNGGIYR